MDIFHIVNRKLPILFNIQIDVWSINAFYMYLNRYHQYYLITTQSSDFPIVTIFLGHDRVTIGGEN